MIREKTVECIKDIVVDAIRAKRHEVECSRCKRICKLERDSDIDIVSYRSTLTILCPSCAHALMNLMTSWFCEKAVEMAELNKSKIDHEVDEVSDGVKCGEVGGSGSAQNISPSENNSTPPTNHHQRPVKSKATTPPQPATQHHDPSEPHQNRIKVEGVVHASYKPQFSTEVHRNEHSDIVEPCDHIDLKVAVDPSNPGAERSTVVEIDDGKMEKVEEHIAVWKDGKEKDSINLNREPLPGTRPFECQHCQATWEEGRWTMRDPLCNVCGVRVAHPPFKKGDLIEREHPVPNRDPDCGILTVEDCRWFDSELAWRVCVKEVENRNLPAVLYVLVPPIQNRSVRSTERGNTGPNDCHTGEGVTGITPVCTLRCPKCKNENADLFATVINPTTTEEEIRCRNCRYQNGECYFLKKAEEELAFSWQLMIQTRGIGTMASHRFCTSCGRLIEKEGHAIWCNIFLIPHISDYMPPSDILKVVLVIPPNTCPDAMTFEQMMNTPADVVSYGRVVIHEQGVEHSMSAIKKWR